MEHAKPSPQTESDDVAKLRHMASEFAEGFNTGDVDRIMRFYGNTYVDINLRSPVQSWQERRQYYAQVIRDGGFRIQVHPDEILVRAILRLSAVQSTSQQPLRPRTPSTGSFATSKLLLGNQTAPGKYCGVWMAPSRSIPRHLEMPVPTPLQMCLDKFSICGILSSVRNCELF